MSSRSFFPFFSFGYVNILAELVTRIQAFIIELKSYWFPTLLSKQVFYILYVNSLSIFCTLHRCLSPNCAQVYSYNLRSLSLIYGTAYLVDISNPTGHRFTLALGFRPVPLNSKPIELASDDHNSDCNLVNVDFNPHMIARQHLEELLNASKSIYSLTTTLLNTLQFFSLWSIFRILFCLTMALRFPHCIIITSDLFVSGLPVFPASSESHSLKCLRCIQLTDAYNQLTGKMCPSVSTDSWDSQTNDRALCNLVPLPAFSVRVVIFSAVLYVSQ
ncbi:unnamed protein product [Heterobilharzia americana]|nr:unnamed protein product [Heterobilharzia americana]